MPKPLTKALHTVRIVEAVARHIVAKHQGARLTAAQLLSATLELIDNGPPADKALYDACMAVCKAVLGE